MRDIESLIGNLLPEDLKPLGRVAYKGLNLQLLNNCVIIL